MQIKYMSFLTFDLVKFSVGILLVVSAIVIILNIYIAKAKKTTKILMERIKNGLNIIVLRSFGKTSLIINGFVVAEKNGFFESNYSLKANFLGNEIVFVHKTNFSHADMFLYYDYELILKEVRSGL